MVRIRYLSLFIEFLTDCVNSFPQQSYGPPPAAYGSGPAGPMDGYNNETPYFPFGHPTRQAAASSSSSTGPAKRKKEVGNSFLNKMSCKY